MFYTLGLVLSFLTPFVMLKAKIPVTPQQASLMIVGFIAFILIIPLVSITVRRLHDSERKGAWVLAYLLPMIIAVVSMIYSMFHFNVETKETETVTSLNPEEYYNRYTDTDGDTIRIYPDYMEQVQSGKRFFYYKANGDSIAVDPSVFTPVARTAHTQQINREQKLIYGTAGIMSFLVILSFVGFIILIIFCALPGTEGPNRYGPDPNVITQPAS